MRTIDDLPEVSFIDDITFEELINDLKNDFIEKKAELQKVDEVNLLATDDISILIDNIALELYQIYRVIDNGLKLNLLKYTTGEYLDNLVAGKNIDRKKGGGAVCRVRFTLSEVQDEDYVIDAGTQLIKDSIVFATAKELIIKAGELTGEIDAACTVKGISGNGIDIGVLNTLVFPLAYVDSVSNITVSAGGDDEESEEDYKNRILNGIYGRSTGGSVPSYDFFIRKYDSEIRDVYIKERLRNGDPTGTVDITLLYPEKLEVQFNQRKEALLKNLIDNGIKVLTDRLEFKLPGKVNVKYKLEYYLLNSNERELKEKQANIDKDISRYQSSIDSVLGGAYEEDVIYSILIANGAKNIAKVNADGYNARKYIKAAPDELLDFGECVLTYKGTTDEIRGSII